MNWHKCVCVCVCLSLVTTLNSSGNGCSFDASAICTDRSLADCNGPVLALSFASHSVRQDKLFVPWNCLRVVTEVTDVLILVRLYFKLTVRPRGSR